MVTLEDMLNNLRNCSDPTLSRLSLNNNYFKISFVEKCFKDMIAINATGSKLNSLEQLGAIVLADSAGIELNE